MIEQKPDILEIIKAEGIELKKKGKNYWALCPLHNERTPSFKVDPEKQTFYCFGCNEHGDVIAFIMKYKNLSFKDALIYLGINNSDKKIIITDEPIKVKKKKLLNDYENWKKSYLGKLADNIRNLTRIKNKAKNMEDVETMAFLYHQEPIWIRHWDILFDKNNEKEKLELYRSLHYGKRKS